MAEYACGECGRANRLGGAVVYEVRQLGIVVRSPSCDNALIRLAHNRGRYLVDLIRGRDALQSESLSSRFNYKGRGMVSGKWRYQSQVTHQLHPVESLDPLRARWRASWADGVC